MIICIGRATSLAAMPLASNWATSPERTSGGKARRIMPIGKLIRPTASGVGRALVLLGRLPGGVGKTIRWVEREGALVPARRGGPGGALRPELPVRVMGIGWVVAVPAGKTVAGIRPVGWGGFTAGDEPVTGGFLIVGGVGCVFATGAGTS